MAEKSCKDCVHRKEPRPDLPNFDDAVMSCCMEHGIAFNYCGFSPCPGFTPKPADTRIRYCPGCGKGYETRNWEEPGIWWCNGSSLRELDPAVTKCDRPYPSEEWLAQTDPPVKAKRAPKEYDFKGDHGVLAECPKCHTQRVHNADLIPPWFCIRTVDSGKGFGCDYMGYPETFLGWSGSTVKTASQLAKEVCAQPIPVPEEMAQPKDSPEEHIEWLRRPQQQCSVHGFENTAWSTVPVPDTTKPKNEGEPKMSRIKKWKRRLLMWSWIYALAALIRCLVTDGIWLWPSAKRLGLAAWWAIQKAAAVVWVFLGPVVMPVLMKIYNHLFQMSTWLNHKDVRANNGHVVFLAIIYLIIATGIFVALWFLSAPMRKRLFPEDA